MLHSAMKDVLPDIDSLTVPACRMNALAGSVGNIQQHHAIKHLLSCSTKPKFMAANVPLTIKTGISPNYNSVIVIGSNGLNLQSTQANLYWVVVVDRTTLSVVVNFTFSQNNQVPQQLNPYIGNPQYFMIFTTQTLSSINLPTGPLYNFLTSQGAGTMLNKAEQIFEALSCGTWGELGYTFVTVLDTDANAGYESFDFYNDAIVSTFQLIPVQVGSGVLYTPVAM